MYLSLRDSGLTEKGTIAVVKSLKASEAPLKTLDLSGNDVTPEACEVLDTLLASVSKFLEELFLDDNEITSDGISNLPSIARCANLRLLSVCTCEITARGAYRVAKAVAKITKFSTLKVDGNQICQRGVDEIRGILVRASKVLGGK